MTFRYLSRQQIIELNRRTVQTHGGNFVPPENLLQGQALDYLVEAVDSQMFGQEIYPTVADKAALYMFNIISNHVFQDGNKRTGLVAALVFLDLNGYRVAVPEDYRSTGGETFSSAQENFIFEFTIRVASGGHTLDSVREWFAAHVVGKQ